MSAVPRDASNSPTPGAALLLAVAPLLIASDSLASGAGLGTALLLASVLPLAVDRSVGRGLPASVRICMFLVLAAAVTALVGLGVAALAPDAEAALRPRLPLVAGSALAIGVAVSLAPPPGTRSPLRIEATAAAACALALVSLGAVRGWLGHGTPLALHAAGALLLAGGAAALHAAVPARRRQVRDGRHRGTQDG